MPHTFESTAIQVERFYTGVISQRNRLAIPIRIMGRRLIELYDAILSGQNAELSVRATLQRACGFIQYNTNTVSGIQQRYYAFQQVSSGTLFPIVDTTTGVFYVPSGSASPTSLITKTQSKQSSFFGVGNYLYIGNPEFSNKWDGGSPQGVTKWGIAIAGQTGSVSAYAGTGADGGGGLVWANPTRVQGAPDSSFSTNAFTAAAHTVVTSNGLNATNYGFAITSTNSIVGVQVTLTGLVDVAANASISVQLLSNGAVIGTAKGNVNPPTASAAMVFGSSSDLWGATFTPSAVNSSTFGVQITGTIVNAGNSPVTRTFSIDSAQISISQSGGPTVTLVAGTLTATQGFQYVLCYGNSVDGNISNPSLVSASIKPVGQGVQISLTASTDPQVNQIRVFRTTDTGTGAVLFELPTSPYPNTTQNVTDNAADTALQVTQAVVAGTLNFSPPPAGLVNIEWYAGRLWGSVGNLLYFSAGPDNTPMGKGTSNWPPGNAFELPTQIVKLCALNGGNGMLAVTLDGIHVVQGISNPGFTVNKWLSDIGARQQNAVDTDGSNIYIFTSDRQFLRISSQGIEELSQAISDQTDLLDPTQVYVCQHRSGSQDSRIFLGDGSTTIYPYNLMMGGWEPKRVPADGGGAGALGSIEISPGIWKMLKGDTRANQLALQRDQNTFSDNGVNYTWNAVFGNIPLADPTQLANVESLVLRMSSAGSVPAVGILPNDISGTFIQLAPPIDEPPEGSQPPTGHQAKKYYLNTGTKLWTQMTHLQIQFSFIAEAVQNEIFSWGIFPNQSTDQAVGAIPQVQGR